MAPLEHRIQALRRSGLGPAAVAAILDLTPAQVAAQRLAPDTPDPQVGGSAAPEWYEYKALWQFADGWDDSAETDPAGLVASNTYGITFDDGLWSYSFVYNEGPRLLNLAVSVPAEAVEPFTTTVRMAIYPTGHPGPYGINFLDVVLNQAGQLVRQWFPVPKDYRWDAQVFGAVKPLVSVEEYAVHY